jgi:hypothetical protein
MMRASRRSPGFNASPLVRQLLQLMDAEARSKADAAEPRQAFAERLSQWLGWTDAIALSAALAAPAGNVAHAGTAPSAGQEEAEALRLRTALARTLAGETTAPAAPRGRPRPLQPEAHAMETSSPDDFTPQRRHYHARQQAMDTAIGPLRARLRAALAARSPALGRLAAVDAVLEQALGERERSLLSVVPVLLEKRFESLRQAHAAGAPLPAGTPAPWLATFRQDMHRLLLAELDHRWLPIDGLLAALRGGQSPTPAP